MKLLAKVLRAQADFCYYWLDWAEWFNPLAYQAMSLELTAAALEGRLSMSAVSCD